MSNTVPNDNSPLLSVAMPVYNEAGCIREAIGDVVRDLLDPCGPAELVVVDDGSRDETPAILDELSRTDSRIRVLHQANAGHGPALVRALEECRGQWLAMLDSDRQIALDDFTAHFAEARRHEGLFGVREHRSDPWLRRIVSIAARTLVLVLFGRWVVDPNVPYKIIPASLWRDAAILLPRGSKIPSLLLAIFAARRRLDVVRREVRHLPRLTGTTVLKKWRLAKFCMAAVGELWAFRKNCRMAESRRTA